ncbi:MAG: EAL domain-containing protein [Lachnospiraceae bacterium]|uniref:Stage 0 sporulation protein A homolog n=1 Tax=Candidatus Weimeria bifida TaxID=2599074 RepID=A0A6N7J3H3_9FIRM|nr:EAL domain-containing protein [Candidatus Weimeria bifida]RRF97347.1 MAG: EAL domain-containing protein [Lachnospiraceae bacterium]
MSSDSGRKCVLIIDDSELNRKQLKDILKDEVDVIEAKNGDEGMNVIREKFHQLDIVLLDLIMPGKLDGFGVLSEMKREHMTDYLPVIMISTNNDPKNIEKAYDLGVLDFISRPYIERIVRRRVLTTIKLFKKQRDIANRIDRNYKADDEVRDSRTGLLYKTNFFNQADTQLRNLNLGNLWMVAVDIDHFKLFNSYYQWETGDAYIKKIGQTLLESAQRHGGVAGYLGGDDFAILCPARMDIVESLSNNLNRYLTDNSFEPSFRVNFGIYPIVASMKQSANDLYDLAAIALETIKGDYTVNISVYDPTMIQKEQDEYKRLLNIQEGIKNGEFTIYLQPKVNISTGKIIGAEALARWNHDGQVLGPNLFVPVMEKNGLISTLDKIIWDRAARFIKKQIEKQVQPIPISVNISEADIYTMDVPELFSEIIRAYDIPAGLLEAEISEATFANAPAKAADTVNRLHEIGMSVSYDDFGTGLASINTIESLNIDMLKVDTSFLRLSADAPEHSRNILEPVLGMAQQFQLPVIIEGVETAEQMEFLEQMGCDYAQGYYFHKPMPAEKFTKLISNPQKLDLTGIQVSVPQSYKVRQILDSSYISDEVIANIFGSLLILNRDGETVRVGWSLQDIDGDSELSDLVDASSEVPLSDMVKDTDREAFLRLFDEALKNRKKGAKGSFIFVFGGRQHLIRLRIFYMRNNINEQIYYAMCDEIEDEEK